MSRICGGCFGGKKDCYTQSHSATENNKTFLIDSTDPKHKEFFKIHIDGCIIEKLDKNKNGKQPPRCDYVFVRCEKKQNSKEIIQTHIFFVELKGLDLKHSIEQLEATIGYFQDKCSFDLKKLKAKACIVFGGGSLPSAANNKYSKLKDQFMEKYGIRLIEKRGILKVRID